MKYLKETNLKMGLTRVRCLEISYYGFCNSRKSLFFQPQNKNYKVTLMDQGKNFLQAS